jgi:hypothetical protein
LRLWPAEILAVDIAGVHHPLLSLVVYELTSLDDRSPAMGSVPDAGMGEPEALTGLDEERFGIVTHVAGCSV